jgi:hypothetical protein
MPADLPHTFVSFLYAILETPYAELFRDDSLTAGSVNGTKALQGLAVGYVQRR